jgi:hypothetical protein
MARKNVTWIKREKTDLEAFITSSWVMLVLLVQGPHFENHCLKTKMGLTTSFVSPRKGRDLSPRGFSRGAHVYLVLVVQSEVVMMFVNDCMSVAGGRALTHPSTCASPWHVDMETCPSCPGVLCVTSSLGTVASESRSSACHSLDFS